MSARPAARLARLLLRPLAVALMLAFARGSADAQAQATVAAGEEAAVRIPLDAYLRGHATGDSSAFRRAFWKEAKLWFVRDGALASRTADEYIAGAAGKPAADEAQRKRWITSVTIDGTAAVAVIELDYPSVHFTDIMTLLRVGDEWRIINKSFHATPKR